MSKADKTFEKVMSGQQDANIRFEDLCHMLTRMGFASRQNGSHVIFTRGSLLFNLQSTHGMAKGYQVRQIRQSFTKK